MNYRFLQSGAGANVVGGLEVKYLRVLERDEETRLIHYERKTEHNYLSVTHRSESSPSSAVPFRFLLTD